jgi:hypothetical protein
LIRLTAAACVDGVGVERVDRDRDDGPRIGQAGLRPPDAGHACDPLPVAASVPASEEAAFRCPGEYRARPARVDRDRLHQPGQGRDPPPGCAAVDRLQEDAGTDASIAPAGSHVHGVRVLGVDRDGRHPRGGLRGKADRYSTPAPAAVSGLEETAQLGSGEDRARASRRDSERVDLRLTEPGARRMPGHPPVGALDDRLPENSRVERRRVGGL